MSIPIPTTLPQFASSTTESYSCAWTQSFESDDTNLISASYGMYTSANLSLAIIPTGTTFDDGPTSQHNIEFLPDGGGILVASANAIDLNFYNAQQFGYVGGVLWGSKSGYRYAVQDGITYTYPNPDTFGIYSGPTLFQNTGISATKLNEYTLSAQFSASLTASVTHNKSLVLSGDGYVETWTAGLGKWTIQVGSANITGDGNGGLFEPLFVGNSGSIVTASSPTLTQDYQSIEWTPSQVPDTTYNILGSVTYTGTTQPPNWQGIGTCTQFGDGSQFLDIGSIKITETSAPDLSSIVINCTSKATDSNGIIAPVMHDLTNVPGFRYMTVDVSATRGSVGNDPNIYLGINILYQGQDFDYDSEMSKLASNSELLQCAWFKIYYDWTQQNTVQTFTIDLAAPLTMYTSQFDALGTGIPIVNTIFGPSTFYDNIIAEYLPFSALCLAVDAPLVSAQLTNPTLTSLNGSQMMINAPNTAELWVDELEANAQVRQPIELPNIFDIGNEGLRIQPTAMIITRDSKPSACLLASMYDGYEFNDVSVTQAVDALNALGNGYTYTLDTQYDLSAIPFGDVCPKIYDSGEGFRGLDDIGLKMYQSGFNDTYLFWWDLKHVINAMWYDHYWRGIAINDFSGESFTGTISFSYKDSAGTEHIGSCQSDDSGYFEFQIPLSWGSVGGNMITFNFVGSLSGTFVAPGFQSLIALRANAAGDSSVAYCPSRNCFWEVQVGRGGLLQVVLRSNVTDQAVYPPTESRKQLSVKGIQPHILICDYHQSVGYILYTDPDTNSVNLVKSLDQFTTLESANNMFSTSYGPTAICYDPATNCKYVAMVVGNSESPTVTQQTPILSIQLIKLDGTDTQIPFSSTTSATIQNAMVNTLYVGAPNVNSVSIAVVPVSRLVIWVGDAAYYSDDGGNTFFDSSKNPLFSTTNVVQGGGVGGFFDGDGNPIAP